MAMTLFVCEKGQRQHHLERANKQLPPPVLSSLLFYFSYCASHFTDHKEHHKHPRHFQALATRDTLDLLHSGHCKPTE